LIDPTAKPLLRACLWSHHPGPANPGKITNEETMIKAYKVNETGLLAIKRFLAQHHKLGDNFEPEHIQAWAANAEDEMARGNPAFVEIPGIVSVTGEDEAFFLPGDGVDFFEVWEAWQGERKEWYEPVRFLVPMGLPVDAAKLGAAAIGLNPGEPVNVKRVV
jgi:hypothetical protein